MQNVAHQVNGGFLHSGIQEQTDAINVTTLSGIHQRRKPVLCIASALKNSRSKLEL
jgi:hypothetical protein